MLSPQSTFSRLTKCAAAKHPVASSLSRSYAVLGEGRSAIGYSRKGDQVAAAQMVLKDVSRLSNGLSIATCDHLGPASSLSVYLNLGSRADSPQHPGMAHLLQKGLVRSLPGDTLLRNVRELELRGNALNSTLNRESLVLTADFLRDDLVDVVPLLLSHLFNKQMLPYEFIEACMSAEKEATAALEAPMTRVVNELHAVAFRQGLGNSLVGTPGASSYFNRSDLLSFLASFLTPDRVALVGMGVSHGDLKTLAENAIAELRLSFSSTKGPQTPASRYFGGEARLEGSVGSEALYAVAYPTQPASDAAAVATSRVLRGLLDTSGRVKWGSVQGTTGALSAANTAETTVHGLYSHYSDAGLIGFVARGSNEDMPRVVKKAVEVMKSFAANISSDALVRAKKSATIDLAEEYTRDAMAAAIGNQVLSTGQFLTVAEWAQHIEKVTAADVNKLAAWMTKLRPSIAAMGRLQLLPYADEL